MFYYDSVGGRLSERGPQLIAIQWSDEVTQDEHKHVTVFWVGR